MLSGGGEAIDGRLRPCDFCKAAASALFCLHDSSFLCLGCDQIIHRAATAANLCHGRVWVCDVCKHAPAAVTCDADAASLCISCDCDVHSANPISGRHVRRPVEPFLDTVTAVLSSSSDDLDRFLCENDGGASWWMDDMKFADAPNAAPSLPPSPCQDLGVVLDETMAPPLLLAPQSAVDDRKARVLRYKEKKKNRKFDKTIRYSSRKAYADARPRTKGRFIKKTV